MRAQRQRLDTLLGRETMTESEKQEFMGMLIQANILINKVFWHQDSVLEMSIYVHEAIKALENAKDKFLAVKATVKK